MENPLLSVHKNYVPNFFLPRGSEGETLLYCNRLALQAGKDNAKAIFLQENTIPCISVKLHNPKGANSHINIPSFHSRSV